jgi:type IV pilus assembly protein PilQ
MVQNAAALVTSGMGGGSIDFLIGKITNSFLDLQLSAMENDGVGKILASPKVITQNNMVAMIKSGLRVPIQTIEEGTVTVKYEDALIRLDALPHIIDSGIFMDLKVIKDDVDEIRPTIAGNPFLLKKEITTKVLVDSGETVVIGGLITQTESEVTKGIPYLSKIPLLGWLFRFEQNINKKTELLIFITPSILEGV